MAGQRVRRFAAFIRVNFSPRKENKAFLSVIKSQKTDRAFLGHF